MEQPTEFVISAALANQILQYLISKPYVEVMQFVMGLQQLKPVETADLSTATIVGTSKEERHGR
jgi:hypothetical protein